MNDKKWDRDNKLILIDLDGVIVNIAKPFCLKVSRMGYRNAKGKWVREEDIKTVRFEDNVFKNGKNISRGLVMDILEHIKPSEMSFYPGIVPFLKEVNEKCNCCFCTAKTFSQIRNTVIFLNYNKINFINLISLPSYISGKGIFNHLSKETYIIDDFLVEGFEDYQYMPSQPWNKEFRKKVMFYGNLSKVLENILEDVKI